MLKSIILTGCRVNMYNEMRALEKEFHELERVRMNGYSLTTMCALGW